MANTVSDLSSLAGAHNVLYAFIYNISPLVADHWLLAWPCIIYAKQKHLGCKKRRGQSEAAVI